MNRSRVVFLLFLLVGVGFSTYYLAVRSDRQWKAVILNNRQDVLWRAAWDGNLEAVRACVEAGADINAGSSDGVGYLPLAQAVREGREDVVRYLLEHGANPNGAAGDNPLIRLCGDRSSGRPSTDLRVARLLLEHGADPNLREVLAKSVYTPLSVARDTRKADLVLLLQQYGAHD